MSELIPIKAITPTSFSHIKTFEQCPKKFYHSNHLNEYPFVETQAIREGHALHKAAELYVRDNLSLPPKFKYAKDTLDSLIAKEGDKFCEIKLGISYDLVPCSFFSKKVWIRGVIDLLIIDKKRKLAWVIDYKTGQNTAWADTDQLELMALLVFASYPEVDEVRAGLVYVQADQLIRKKYVKSKRNALWSGWIARHQKMVDAHKQNVWATKESGLCRKHCPVEQCVHNGANN